MNYWVRVKNRLPECSGDYMVMYTGNILGVSHFDFATKEFEVCNNDVIAWKNMYGTFYGNYHDENQ